MGKKGKGRKKGKKDKKKDEEPPRKNKSTAIYFVLVLDAALMSGAIYLFTSKPTCDILQDDIKQDVDLSAPEDSVNFVNFECGVSRVKFLLDPWSDYSKKNLWPWIALLRKKYYASETYGDRLCPTTVITSRHAISNCECVDDKARPADFRILFGHQTKNGGEREIEVAIFRRHPHCNLDGDDYVRFNNILLITVKNEIKFDDMVQPACLPKLEPNSATFRTCFQFYWWDYRMQHDPVKIASADECSRMVANSVATSMKALVYKEKPLCTKDYQGNKCIPDEFDSFRGRPITCYVDKMWILYGVGNWGSQCDFHNYTGVFSRILRYMSWICCFIKDHPSCRDTTCLEE